MNRSDAQPMRLKPILRVTRLYEVVFQLKDTGSRHTLHVSADSIDQAQSVLALYCRGRFPDRRYAPVRFNELGHLRSLA
ncbi:MAG: hypothetical protein AAGE65_09515 [Planctomycetota bacterium]